MKDLMEQDFILDENAEALLNAEPALKMLARKPLFKHKSVHGRPTKHKDFKQPMY